MHPQGIQPWRITTSGELFTAHRHLLSEEPQSGLGQLLEGEAACPASSALDGDPALSRISALGCRDVDRQNVLSIDQQCPLFPRMVSVPIVPDTALGTGKPVVSRSENKGDFMRLPIRSSRQTGLVVPTESRMISASSLLRIVNHCVGVISRDPVVAPEDLASRRGGQDRTVGCPRRTIAFRNRRRDDYILDDYRLLDDHGLLDNLLDDYRLLDDLRGGRLGRIRRPDPSDDPEDNE